MVSISVGPEGGATEDRFFSPLSLSPHTPNGHMKPQIPSLSLPPVTKRGATWKEKPDAARVGGELVAGGSADPRRRGPRAGGARDSRASHPARAHGEPEKRFRGVLEKAKAALGECLRK